MCEIQEFGLVRMDDRNFREILGVDVGMAITKVRPKWQFKKLTLKNVYMYGNLVQINNVLVSFDQQE